MLHTKSPNRGSMAIKEKIKDENKITVVIPNYNGVHFLKDCLRSLFEGDLLPHIIVVDNGSRDGSAQWVAEHYPSVELILFQENTGFCRAVNAGIKKATTEYVILLNNDTVVASHFVAGLWEAIRRDGRIFSVGAKMLCMDAPEKIDDAGDFYCALGWAFARGKHRPAGRYQKEGHIFAACGGAAIYRKSLVAELGYFDETHFAYLEDIDLGYRAQIYGYYNLYTPRAEVRHVGSGASGSRYNRFKTDLASRNSIYLIYKNMPLLQIIINVPFLLIGFAIKAVFFARKGMGLPYLEGLVKGVALSAGPQGRVHKVRFQAKNMIRYLRIQGQLFRNLFLLLCS